MRLVSRLLLVCFLASLLGASAGCGSSNEGPADTPIPNVKTQTKMPKQHKNKVDIDER